jgi:uncharacterized protein HemX
MCEFGSYCCRAVGDDNNCCNNATAPQIRTNSLGAFPSTVRLVPTSSPAATSTPAPTSVFATAVSTGVPFQQTPTSRSQDSAEHACKKDKSATVGGAVGGVLGAIILAMAGAMFWLYQKEKRQRKLKEHYEEQFGQNWAWRRTLIVDTDSKERSELSTACDEKETMGPAAAHS